ncbi:MAG: Druantia anti-phage system protein DruA [bacterium]
MKEKLIIRKRVLEESDIALIKELIINEGSKGRTYISKRLCKYWDWRQANGRYREITCRELLRKLDSLGIISLPPMLNPARRPGYKNIPTVPVNLNKKTLEGELKPLKGRIVFRQVRGTSEESCFNGLIEGYHYLGYCQGAGEQLKYLVFLDGDPIACIGFGISALKVACRDKFIGWNAKEKDRNLHKVVNNSRFLILPWVRIPHLASFILGRTLRHINRDWIDRYCRPIVLVETFVDIERFSGVCYRASNWRNLGLTTGRGRNDRHTRREKSVKAVFVRELCPNFREECHV